MKIKPVGGTAYIAYAPPLPLASVSTLPTVLVVGALYASSERGLAADLLAARAMDLAPLPVCTQLVMAGGNLVTDVTDVPTDTVAAQIEHTLAVHRPAGVKVGILAGHHTARVVLDAVAALGVPTVLDLVASGPSGETVLTAKGIDAVAERLGVPTLVTVSRRDAELVTGGEIASLDDAQVAAQRIVGRGARAVVVRCGSLPYRFYDAADDPGGDGAASTEASRFSFDLYYDGEDFALFEAPLLDGDAPEGASSAFAMSLLARLIAGDTPEAALQHAKRYVTESIRQQTASPVSRLAYHWDQAP